MSEVILQLMHDRNMPEDLILRTIEETLLAAYKRRYGGVENAIVRFNDEREVSIHAKKKIVNGEEDGVDPLWELDIMEARELNPDAEVGDEILIEIDPKKEFDRISVQIGKQTARQSLREIQKDSLYSEYRDKVGELIIGYYQRERNGTIYVDLGKMEGILPRKYQSPRESYHTNDRIKALITEVNKTQSSCQVVLSRTHTDFVRGLFEQEVPEIYDKTVEIHKIVREPGYRTKLAVYSNREEVDPVGACVGPKGGRIQTVIKELEGEKIDVLKYDPDPRRFIKNALSPAEVRDVIILDESKHQALAVVSDSQLSLAIGKQGLNVRLANRLVDWNIDVKTDAQFAEMDVATESRRAVSALFGETDNYGELSRISELPGVDQAVVNALLENGTDFIQDFLELSEEGMKNLPNINAEQLDTLRKLIDEYVVLVEEEEDESVSDDNEESGNVGSAKTEADENAAELEVAVSGSAENEEVEEYECPECGAKITLDMTNCPNCGVGLSFEFEDE
ncbi:MAG: transcription termination factor NusA [Treponema sp.]|jgi:N utilization substance protein A|nr:transcription termination factor NusA [Treponema sp.]